MQTGNLNTNINFNAKFSSVFNDEIGKLRERIYRQLGNDSLEMNQLLENISNMSQKFRDGKIVICKKGQKGTFLEQNNKRNALLSPKYKKLSLNDINEIAHKLEQSA